MRLVTALSAAWIGAPCRHANTNFAEGYPAAGSYCIRSATCLTARQVSLVTSQHDMPTPKRSMLDSVNQRKLSYYHVLWPLVEPFPPPSAPLMSRDYNILRSNSYELRLESWRSAACLSCCGSIPALTCASLTRSVPTKNALSLGYMRCIASLQDRIRFRFDCMIAALP